ncbi:MAG: hypothetical protein ACRC76_03725 [Proteocatella sp.]
MKKKVYLDHNVFILAESSKEIFEYLCSIKKNYTYYYSPAHIEEIFKKYKAILVKSDVKRKCNFHDNKLKELVQLFLVLKGYPIKNNIDHLISLMKCIELITGKKDILPAFFSYGSINWEIIESTLDCFGRVAGEDTTDIINLRGREIYDSAQKIRQTRKDDKTIMNIPNLNEEDIWNNKYIQESIRDFNENKIIEYIEDINKKINKKKDLNNSYTEISKDFRLKPFLLKDRKYLRHEMELAFEGLFEILNVNGYRSEKDYNKAVSSIHDVSHAIYGSYCDIFITCDLNFYKKIKAVYYYIGIKTEVHYCCQKSAYNSILKSIGT